MNDPLLAAAYVVGLGSMLGYVISLRMRRARAIERQALLERETQRDGLDREAR